MGKAEDAAAKEFLAVKENFADVFNIGLFKKNIIDAGRLEQLNTDITTPVFSDNGKIVAKSIEHILDELRVAAVTMRDGGTTYVMLGVQAQEDVHLAMPVRDMLVSAQLYDAEVRTLSIKNKGRHNRLLKKRKSGATLSVEEEEFIKLMNSSPSFLSGLLPSDRLYPVVILVLYLGEREWTLPVSISDMLIPIGDDIMRYVNDYRINVVRPEDVMDGDPGSQFVKAMTLISMGLKGKDALVSLSSNLEYENLSPITVRLVNTVLGSRFPIEKNKGEYVNMCKAIKEINEEIEKNKKDLENKDKELEKNKKDLENKDKELKDKDKELKDKDKELKDKNKYLEDKDRELKNKDKEIENKDRELKNNREEIKKLNEELAKLRTLVGKT